MMVCEHTEMIRSGDPLCPLSAVGGEMFMMRCHKNCAWLVTMNHGHEAVCSVVANACGGFMGAPIRAKNPIRIGG